MPDTDTLNQLIEILSNEKSYLFEVFGVTDLAIFGSYARSDQTKDSDVDIFVELMKGYKTFDNFMDLKFYLEEILDKKVDLVIKGSIRQELRPKILTEGVHV